MDQNSDSQDIVETTTTENNSAEVETEQAATEQGHGEAATVENTDADNAGDGEPKADPEPPKRNRAQERIQQLAREKAELARELESYKSKKDEAQTLERPKIESFETYDEYEEAVDAYRIAKAEQNVLSKLEKDKTEKSQAQRNAEFQGVIDSVAETLEDFDGVVTAGINRQLPMPITLDELASEFGYDPETQVKLLYELAKDAEFHEQVSGSSKLKAAKLLSDRADSLSKKTAPKIPNAPKPIKPTSANAPVKRDTATMSDDEFLRSRGL